MDEKAFARAREEAKLAASKLEAMKTAKKLAALAQLWSEFLTHIQRAFTKMKIATANGPSKRWYDTIENIRRTDDLLSYIRHARNADEHGVESVTHAKPGGIGISPKVGNTLHVDYLEMNKGQMTLGPELAKNAIIEFIPVSIHLSAVRDRASTYQPPKPHLGNPIQNATLIGAAEAAITYLEAALSEAKAKFGA